MDERQKVSTKIGIGSSVISCSLPPYHRTEGCDIAEENDLFLTKDWSKYTTLDPVMKIAGITAKELKNFLLKACLSFYLRPSFVWEPITEGRFWTFLNMMLGR